MLRIPRYITVHLGSPVAEAENAVISFKEYIKNTASCAVYPTWHENAVKANIYALNSGVFNRIWGGYYRGAGFNFDITSDPLYDPLFIPGRATFENVDNIVNEIFGSFIAGKGGILPISAETCDGVREKGIGFSKWGSLNLAEQGYSPLEILKFYYGDHIEVVTAEH